MSENQSSAVEVENVKLAKDAYQKIAAKTKRSTCPYCDNTKWFLLNTKNVNPVLMLADLNNYPIYALSCTNCGFIRQHLSTILDGMVVGETEFVESEKQPDVR